MIYLNRYPYFKVFAWFAICPFLISGVIALLLIFVSMFNFFDGDESLFKRVFVSLPLAFYIFSLGFLYFPPAAFLSIIYSLLRVRRGVRGVLFVSFLGGLGSQLWNFFFFGPTGKNIFPAIFLPNIVFFMGFLSSLVVGVAILPKKYIELSNAILATNSD